jgi:hypothetical protein
MPAASKDSKSYKGLLESPQPEDLQAIQSNPNAIIPYDDVPATLEQKHEVVVWDHGNPRSLINLVSPKIKQTILTIPPDWLTCPEDQLERIVNPTEIDRELRITFWEEFQMAQDSAQPVKLGRVYGKVCTKEYFHMMITGNPKRIAYMIRPPRDYMLQMKSLLALGMRRFEEILQLPIKENDKVNTRLIGEVVKIVSLIDNRVRGAVPQRLQIDQRSMNLNMQYEAPKSAGDIESEIKKLQKEIVQLAGPQMQTEISSNLFAGGVDEPEPVRQTIRDLHEDTETP